MDIKRLGFKSGEPIGDCGQCFADGFEVVQRLAQCEVLQVLLRASSRRKVVNFSYMRMTALFAPARKT
jgi:hypothetical protein